MTEKENATTRSNLPKAATSGRLKPPTKVDPALKKIPVEKPEEEFKVHTLKRKAPSSTDVQTETKSTASNAKQPIASRSIRTATLRGRTVAKPTASTLAKSAIAPKAKTATAKPVTTAAEEGPRKKKRPAWDLKGRVQDLEERNEHTGVKLQESSSMISTLNDQLALCRNTITELTQFRNQQESSLKLKEEEKSTIEATLLKLRHEKEEAASQHDETLNKLKAEHRDVVEKLSKELEQLRVSHEATLSELTYVKAENTQLKTTIAVKSAESLAVESSNRTLKLQLETSETLTRDQSKQISGLQNSIQDLQLNVQDLNAKLREEETVRRRLHNTIQELKGNIRVFCRIRPPLPNEMDEQEGQTMTHILFPERDEGGVELVQTSENASGSKTISKVFPFSFDKVFQPGTTQLHVFEEISQLVQSALDGYNVCIFAYGQTGSGKTYTMEGPNSISGETDPNIGMIPRAVQQIFLSAEQLKEKGWVYQMEGQFIEIYNESIRDLLGNDDSNKKHEIKHDPFKGRTTVTDVLNVPVQSPQEVFKLLQKASENRAVASTNCNERSSRSHSVFTMKLSGTNTLTEETSEGILNLIDLAGSERLSSSGSTGDRLKETQAINKSLSCLGDVIFALSNKDAHIPYRNSKLTYLLQNSLGGNSKTLMFVNISPSADSLQESLCSLRFATKVNNCQIGTARRQTVVASK